MQLGRMSLSAALLGLLGVVGVLVLHWMVFFWVPTESTMGIVQRIFYIHVPSAWVAFMAFGIVALASEYGRYGYRRVHALLLEEGWQVSHSRVMRIWRQEGLKKSHTNNPNAVGCGSTMVLVSG